MKTIPMNEILVSDQEVFASFDLNCSELRSVGTCLERHDLLMAKKELLRYFETRTEPQYFFDYRSLPLSKLDMEVRPSFFYTSAGADRSLKEFCLYAGRKLADHIYVRHGNEGIEIDLGPDYENLPHFNYYEDQGKKHRTILDIFVRGHIFEYLAVLYHETGDKKVLAQFEETLQMFLKHYPLVLECTAADASHFSFTEERDVMSSGYLALQYLSLLYTRIPYEINPELAFDIIKRIWFLGIQFRRFDTDTYRSHNHHMWERGLVPFMLATLLPEIPDFSSIKNHSVDVIRQHIRDDFNENGGYSEHSISYWSGAALGGMLCRGISLARLNGTALLDEDTSQRIGLSYNALALISPPQPTYPAVGDSGGSSVNAVLTVGAKTCGNRYCSEALAIRSGESGSSEFTLPLDFCDERCGFVCSRSSFSTDGNYMLMSAKINCGESGHNHMDMLSLALSWGGQEFIGEPHSRQLYHTIRMGSDHRGYMYNMESHNTVLVHGQPVQPNRVYANKWGVRRPDSPVSAYVSCANGLSASAYHDAYTFCRHQRHVLFHRKKGILIRDEILGGSRLPEAHIQRWNLMPDVVCTQIDDSALLLKKQGVTLLCLWSETPSIHIWKKENLCPEIVKKQAELSTIIDVSFYAVQEGQTVSDIAAQSLMVLDVTDCPPDAARCCRIRQSMAAMASGRDTEHALDIFSLL